MKKYQTGRQNTSSESEFLELLAENRNEMSVQTTDGIHCDKCKNKGYVYTVNNLELLAYDCDCKAERETAKELKRVSLFEMYLKADLSKFKTDQQFQKIMLKKGQDYVDGLFEQGKWLFIGGQVGSGKTHLALSVIKALHRKNKVKDVSVFNWVEDARLLKQIQFEDSHSYQAIMKNYKRSQLLFIDDLFQGNPTEADTQIAYDIINARYGENRATIITSEKYLSQIYGYRKSLSRINEKAVRVEIAQNEERNLRL